MMQQRSMIEGRSVLVTLMDDDLRPVADRCEATLVQVVFEDDGETLFYGTGRPTKVAPWTLRTPGKPQESPGRRGGG
jgi:hypothetical protein